MTGQRYDLGASFARLARAMLDAETPILDRHGLDMWEYVVLSALKESAMPTQSELAVAVHRDKTRLIPILDDLESQGMLTRTPDPADRRNRIVALTERGGNALEACQADVRTMEEEFLAEVPADKRSTFIEVLELLAHRRR